MSSEMDSLPPPRSAVVNTDTDARNENVIQQQQQQHAQDDDDDVGIRSNTTTTTGSSLPRSRHGDDDDDFEEIIDIHRHDASDDAAAAHEHHRNSPLTPTSSQELRKRNVAVGAGSNAGATTGNHHVRDSSSSAAAAADNAADTAAAATAAAAAATGDINNNNPSNDATSNNHGAGLPSNQNRNNNQRLLRHHQETTSTRTRTTDNTSQHNHIDHHQRLQHQQPQQPNQNQNQQQQQQPPSTNQTYQTNPQSLLLRQQFWKTYDTIIILSLSSVLGIVFRMMSATWFRLNWGVVFSEDSALGTNLPLNIWSCFLMGLLCSGREAMGIVHSKVLGGANPYGSGRGILDVGKGAYRGVVDAGKAGLNRARRYKNVKGANSNRDRYNNNTLTLESSSSNMGSESSVNNDSSFSRNDSSHSSVNSTIAQSVDGGVGGVQLSLSPRNTIRNRSNHTNSNISSNNNIINQANESEETIAGLLGLDDEFQIVGSHVKTEDEIRQVQLRGLTRRIMASPSLVLFAARKESNDVMEHYENDLLPPPRASTDEFEIGNLDDVNSNVDVESGDIEMSSEQTTSSSGEASGEASRQQHHEGGTRINNPPSQSIIEPPVESQQQTHPESNNNNESIRHQSSSTIEEQVDEIIHSISDHVTTIRRVHLLDGWNVDTSPEKMKHIILLGLRVGFCGALSTFSSLNASVIRLLRAGAVGEALVGYAISIQMGIVSYRFGQHVAVYIFVWRCRRETKRDEKRGYGLRLRRVDSEDLDQIHLSGSLGESAARQQRWIIPSVRTVATLSFLSMFVSLCLAMFFSTNPNHTQYWCSLLFTPFGCLARFALMSKYNKNLPGFPLGTFSCNLLSCALSGSIGSFLAGNPGPQESILLTSMIAGFAGSLSTFATFIVEILSLMDPIIFKFDGLVYAGITILWAIIIGALGSQAKNWADEV